MSAQSLGSQLFKMTSPMVMGVLSLMSFQLVDSAFIGQLGVTPLAAQGFTLPMQMVIIGLQVGFGVSASVLISKAIGAGKALEAREFGGLVTAIGSAVVLLACVLIYLFRDGLLDMLGASADVKPLVDGYWLWWLASAWLGAFLYFLYSLCRANGNTILPGTMMMVTSLINMALDPLFIFGLDMGLNGAAIATCLAFITGIGIVYVRVQRQQWLEFHFDALDLKTALPEMFHIQAPAMLSQMMPSISALLATKLLAGFGSTAVAMWALGSRFEFFSIVVVLALTMSLPPMVSRAWGAGQLDQVQALVKISLLFVLGWQLLIACISWLAAGALAGLMSADTQVSGLLSQYLSIVPFSLGALGSCMLLVSVSNALGKSYSALMISIVRLFVCYLPCIWLGAQMADMEGIFWGALIGNILAGSFAYVSYRKTLKGLLGG
ncbi:MATE family efflux transporter [Oceanobacter mangrovi]|uniref:MATE family efflux transporter n=1 Tax=Oceanobacter mangrovi TaxID=2862510 RepID=UPI001FEB747D|nr:MATE family efflux transporter [Oceanobacter mangrovi]